MKFLRYLWFSAACFVAFIYVVAGRKRDNDTRSTIFTAYPGNLCKLMHYIYRTFTEKTSVDFFKTTKFPIKT